MQLDLTQEDIQKRGLVWNGRGLPYNPNNIEKAKILRKSMTPAEKKLWMYFLKNYKEKFYRQRPIDHFIADFYCPKKNLVIEVDGGVHSSSDVKEYDSMRTDLLALYGLTVIRFSNEEVLGNFDWVCERIGELL